MYLTSAAALYASVVLVLCVSCFLYVSMSCVCEIYVIFRLSATMFCVSVLCVHCICVYHNICHVMCMCVCVLLGCFLYDRFVYIILSVDCQLLYEIIFCYVIIFCFDCIMD